MSYERIICIVDLSPESRSAAELARAIAKQHDAEVELLRAAEPPMLTTNVGGVDPEALIEHAMEADADLIVVGAREPGFFDRVLHRSRSEKLARRACCPVLVVASTAAVEPPLEHLVVATDYTEQSREAARIASELVGPDGKLSFVHAWHQPKVFSEAPLTNAAGAVLRTPIELSGAAELEQLRTFVASLPVQAASVDTYLEVGEPVTTLAKRAKKIGADAVVVGSHPHEDWGERLFGTIADRVLEQVERPVLAVPSGAIAAAPEAP